MKNNKKCQKTAKIILKNGNCYVIIKLPKFVNNIVNKHTNTQIYKRTNNVVSLQGSCYKHIEKNICSNGRIKIMCKASELGKIVVNKCLERGLFINTQKLQKLLVLIQVECIRQSGFPFFSEDIRVWNCGVAIKEVDDDFRLFGVSFEEQQIPNIVLLKSEEKYIDKILDEYGVLSADKLNELDINQRVISLGEIRDGDTVKHISATKLTEVFRV